MPSLKSIVCNETLIAYILGGYEGLPGYINATAISDVLCTVPGEDWYQTLRDIDMANSDIFHLTDTVSIVSKEITSLHDLISDVHV